MTELRSCGVEVICASVRVTFRCGDVEDLCEWARIILSRGGIEVVRARDSLVLSRGGVEDLCAQRRQAQLDHILGQTTDRVSVSCAGTAELYANSWSLTETNGHIYSNYRYADIFLA